MLRHIGSQRGMVAVALVVSLVMLNSQWAVAANNHGWVVSQAASHPGFMAVFTELRQEGYRPNLARYSVYASDATDVVIGIEFEGGILLFSTEDEGLAAAWLPDRLEVWMVEGGQVARKNWAEAWAYAQEQIGDSCVPDVVGAQDCNLNCQTAMGVVGCGLLCVWLGIPGGLFCSALCNLGVYDACRCICDGICPSGCPAEQCYGPPGEWP